MRIKILALLLAIPFCAEFGQMMASEQEQARAAIARAISRQTKTPDVVELAYLSPAFRENLVTIAIPATPFYLPPIDIPPAITPSVTLSGINSCEPVGFSSNSYDGSVGSDAQSTTIRRGIFSRGIFSRGGDGKGIFRGIFSRGIFSRGDGGCGRTGILRRILGR